MKRHLIIKSSVMSAPLAAVFLCAAMAASYSLPVKAEAKLPVPVEKAETSADHEKLAEFFEQQAKTAQERLTWHQDLQDQYRKSTQSLRSLPIGQGGSVSLSIVRHCEILVENARRDVEAYRAIAQQHREMAKTAEK